MTQLDQAHSEPDDPQGDEPVRERELTRGNSWALDGPKESSA